MLSLNHIYLPLANWNLLCHTLYYQQYKFINQVDYLTCWMNLVPPELPYRLDEIKHLSKSVRKDILKVNGGLISLENKFIANIPTLKCIYKFPDADQRTPIYCASVRLLFEQFCITIKVQSRSIQNWEEREQIIKEMLLESAPTQQDKNKILKNWLKDPYSSRIKKGLLKNRSEDEVFDHQFPGHALTRVRKHMTHFEEHLKLEKGLAGSPVYKPKTNELLKWN